MDIRIGDRLTMKKQHPCGSKEMLVLRSGMDFKLRCCGCGHEFMVMRNKIEKNIKAVNRAMAGNEQDTLKKAADTENNTDV